MGPKIHYVSTAGKGLATFRAVPEIAPKGYDFDMGTNKDKKPEPPRWAIIARSIMDEQDITQEDLTEVFDRKTRGAVGHYFRGIREPSIEQIARLAKRLGISVSQLIGEVPLTPSASSTNEVSRLLEQIDEGDLPLLMNMLRAAASSARNNEEK